MNKKKKPFYRRWWFILLIAILLLSRCGNKGRPAEEKSTKQDEVPNEDGDKKNKDVVEAEEIELAIDKAIEKNSKNVDKASIDGNELTLEYRPETLFSENSFMRVVYDMFQEVKVGFSYEGIESVVVVIEAVMVDEKGNEEIEPVVIYNYTREGFEELNYDKFNEMAYSEEWRILNEADYYTIHPGIKNKLKDKYIQNLR